MANTRERFYEHAPLTEVIAEAHWRLTPLQIMPGAQVDPFYASFEDRFTSELAQQGFSHIEARVPFEVPREMLGHNVVRLFRSAPAAWPVYQIGPGVLTANVTPPYKGWSTFRPFVHDGLRHWLKAYPEPKFLHLERLLLRYVNVFDERFGVTADRFKFVKEHLGFALALPAGIEAMLSEPEGMTFGGDIRVPTSDVSLLIEWKNGAKSDGKPIVLLNIIADMPVDVAALGADVLIDKFDVAHSTISKCFESIVDGSLREHLGRESEVVS